MAAEPKWQQDFSSEHPDEWTDEDELEWQEANASRFAPDDRQLGQILGVVSIGLGLAQLLAPRAVGRAIGVGDHPAIMRMVGVREIVTGLGILSERAPGAWAWARVAGDAIDLALLGAATSSPDADPRRIAAATAGVLGVAALDVYSGQRLTASQSTAPAISVTQAITINSAGRSALFPLRPVPTAVISQRRLDVHRNRHLPADSRASPAASVIREAGSA